VKLLVVVPEAFLSKATAEEAAFEIVKAIITANKMCLFIVIFIAIEGPATLYKPIIYHFTKITHTNILMYN